MSFPETGALPLKEVRALLQLNDLIAAIHEWVAESEGQVWAPSETTVSSAIQVATAITPKAGCPDVTPTESGTVVLDWSAADSWATVEIRDETISVISAAKDRQTTRMSGTLASLDAIALVVAEAVRPGQAA